MRETDHLVALARACLVRITVAGQVGSGFLAAPGYVLSCAHVGGAGHTATVEWNGQKYEAAVRYAQPVPPYRPRALLDYPDLAVLELVDPPAGHPCAGLDLRLPTPAGRGRPQWTRWSRTAPGSRTPSSGRCPRGRVAAGATSCGRPRSARYADCSPRCRRPASTRPASPGPGRRCARHRRRCCTT